MNAEFVARSRHCHHVGKFAHIVLRRLRVADAVFLALANLAPRALIHACQDDIIVGGDVNDDRSRRLDSLETRSKSSVAAL